MTIQNNKEEILNKNTVSGRFSLVNRDSQTELENTYWHLVDPISVFGTKQTVCGMSLLDFNLKNETKTGRITCPKCYNHLNWRARY
jgi:hypothetical protein